MPNKISETQFFHVAEREGLLSLTLPLNGEPFDMEVLEGFVYEVKERHRRLALRVASPHSRPRPRGDTRAGLGSRLAASTVSSAVGSVGGSMAGSVAGSVAERVRRASVALGRGLYAAGVSPALVEALIPEVRKPGPQSDKIDETGKPHSHPTPHGSRRRR
jgi:hypothetical protein